MTSSDTSSLILFLVQEHLTAWFSESHGIPQAQPIEGESGWLRCQQAQSLVQFVGDLQTRLSEKLSTSFRLEFVYDRQSRKILEESLRLPQLQALLEKSLWEIQRLEILTSKAGVDLPCTDSLPPKDWVQDNLLLILLLGSDRQERERLQEAVQQEHQNFKEELRREREQLLQENQILRAQNAALRTVDMELLVSYLPALFPRIFTLIGAADLAMLTHRVEHYVLPNPYPEPSPETLHTMQRQFRDLPRETQRQIVGFVSNLPQRQQLRPRQEMQELVLELEREANNVRK